MNNEEAPLSFFIDTMPTTIDRIKKRDGKVVEFDRTRIENAILQACIATKTELSSIFIAEITNKVVEDIDERFSGNGATPHVEDIQDLVERELMENHLYDLAKEYILARSEHEKIREGKQKEILERVEKHDLTVKKRDGSMVPFDMDEIEHMVRAMAKGIDGEIDVQGILEDCKSNLYDGIPTSEINQGLIMAMRGLIEQDPVYSHLATKTLFNDLYRDILGEYQFADGFEELYKSSFEIQLKKGVHTGRIDPKLLMYDMGKISAALRPERDDLIRYLGAQTLYDRYFFRDYDQNILETPQYFWMRIAMGLALDEEEQEEKAIAFYEVMSPLLYTPSTPTLFHSGTTHPQMSSCYLTTVEDDLGHIFKSIGDNAQLSKWSGGLGGDWTNIRGTGSLIKSTNVGSQGVIPFLKIVDSATAAINRSGKRRGATCVYLETWHYDIEDFIELRKNTGDDRRRTHDTNTANWIPDLFIKRVMEDRSWTLFSPDETPDLHHIYGKKFERVYENYEKKADRGEITLWKRVQAKDLWKKMVTQLYETGHPWVTFKDPCNIRSPQDHVGVVHSSNLCTEITLNTSKEETAVCNLGSINLVNHIREGGLDRELLEHTVRTAMRMLDNVIDLNYYPTQEAKNSNLRHRPVGLGMMGLQDALYKVGVNFDTPEAVAFSDETMEFISYYAILTSSELAKEKGSYVTYRGSKWDRGLFPIDTLDLLEEERGVPTEVDKTTRMDWDRVKSHVTEYGMRNSNCMAIAPTATIANINGVFPSVEPPYKNVYTKSNFSGEFTVVNDYLIEDLKSRGLWDKDMLEKIKHFDGSIQPVAEIPEDLQEKYKEVFEIDPIWIIRHAAHRGKWIDQSQSINIFSASTSGRFISDVYMAAWQMGLKTTYYLRSMGASSIEKSTININKKYEQPQDTTTTPAPVVEAPVQTEPVPQEPTSPPAAMEKAEQTEGEKHKALVCSIENGEECEACQ